MKKLARILGWLLRHLYVGQRNLNDDPEAKPIVGTEIGIKGTF